MNKAKSELHQIARMMAYAITLNSEREEFQTLIDEITHELRKLNKTGKIALRSAWIFSRKVPQMEREDLFQDLFCELWAKRVESEKLAYTIARCDWQDWYKRYKIRHHYSLDMAVNEDNDDSVPYGELLIGAIDFEQNMCLSLDCQRLLSIMPADIKAMVMKRFAGRGLDKTERNKLNYWARKHSHLMAV